MQALVRAVQKLLRDGPFAADLGGVCFNLNLYSDAYGDVCVPVYDIMDAVSAIYPGEKHPGGGFEYAVTTEVQFYDSNTGELHTKNTQYRRERFAALTT